MRTIIAALIAAAVLAGTAGAGEHDVAGQPLAPDIAFRNGP